MLLSSGVPTMYLGWTKSRGPGVLGSSSGEFWGSEVFSCNLFYFIFSKFLLIDFSFSYASIQWHNNHVSGVDKVQGPRGLREAPSDFLGHDFSKFSLIDFSFNYASTQWRNKYSLKECTRPKHFLVPKFQIARPKRAPFYDGSPKLLKIFKFFIDQIFLFNY